MDSSISDELATAWIAKAQPLVDPLLPGQPPVTVHARGVPDPANAPYGAFMMGWPEPAGSGFVLGHLVDCEFFLALLRRCYADVLAARPGLGLALDDRSRLEVALTNDVLQVRAPGPPEPYSMIRHHALMLFAATDWLAEPARSRWFEIYEAVAAGLTADGAKPPSPAEIADTEAAAFADFIALAPESVDPEGARRLLAGPRLDAVLRYQTLAAAAIGVLARECGNRSGTDREEWFRDQLATGYRDPDYLLEDWERLL
ncbi:MAG TPA: hypothetical protein VFG87_17565 [Amycolatopsis sp.]|nr:hypothetical protein [Amycolatopsis sp.]